jgi:hypothetical protein
MPSSRYYRQQAKSLLAWASATGDKAYANRLREQAAKELERAKNAREAVADLNPLLAEFNEQQMRKSRWPRR